MAHAGRRTKEDPMNPLARYWINYANLTRRECLRAAWYAVIIFAPVIALILAHLWYGPGLDQVMEW
jgi:hypothetical protein